MLVDNHVKICEAILAIKKSQKGKALTGEITLLTGLKSNIINASLTRLIKLGIIESQMRGTQREFKVNQGAYAKSLISPKRAWKSDKITKTQIAKKKGISRQWLYELEKRNK